MALSDVDMKVLHNSLTILNGLRSELTEFNCRDSVKPVVLSRWRQNVADASAGLKRLLEGGVGCPSQS